MFVSVVEERARQERAERTRAHIVEVAATAFAEHGFDGISLNDVVRRSGVSKGAFYFHFSSKEELALAAFQAKQTQLIGRLAAGAGPSASATEALADMWRRRNRLLAEDPSLGCVTRLGGELNTRSSPGSAFAAYHEAPIEMMAGLVRRGQEAGELRSDLDAGAVARAIFAWVVGVDTLSLLSTGGKDLEERSEEVLALLLPGLADHAGAPSPRRRPRARSTPGDRSREENTR